MRLAIRYGAAALLLVCGLTLIFYNFDSGIEYNPNGHNRDGGRSKHFHVRDALNVVQQQHAGKTAADAQTTKKRPPPADVGMPVAQALPTVNPYVIQGGDDAFDDLYKGTPSRRKYFSGKPKYMDIYEDDERYVSSPCVKYRVTNYSVVFMYFLSMLPTTLIHVRTDHV